MTVMQPDDLDLHFYPTAALSDTERADWHRIILSEIGAASGSLTAVFVREPLGWVLEGFVWGGTSGGFFALGDGRFLPLRTRVVAALKAAGKQVRTP
ncbi:MAG: hypothetical protein ACM3PV_04245 [Betaproteobacteria bacterium]